MERLQIQLRPFCIYFLLRYGLFFYTTSTRNGMLKLIQIKNLLYLTLVLSLFGAPVYGSDNSSTKSIVEKHIKRPLERPIFKHQVMSPTKKENVASDRKPAQLNSLKTLRNWQQNPTEKIIIDLIKPCWNPFLPSPPVTLLMKLNRDGSLREPLDLIETTNHKWSAYVFNSILECLPLKDVPKSDYNSWRDIEIFLRTDFKNQHAVSNKAFDDVTPIVTARAEEIIQPNFKRCLHDIKIYKQIDEINIIVTTGISGQVNKVYLGRNTPKNIFTLSFAKEIAKALSRCGPYEFPTKTKYAF